MHPIVELAKEAVECYVQERRVIVPDLPPEDLGDRAGVFVTLKIGGMLRGCIGTFAPAQASLVEEVVANAISSASQDPRFYEVQPHELPLLEYSVDVLTPAEPVIDPAELDPKRFGVIVECLGRKGLLLPDLEGVDTVDDQISICRRKAGIALGEEIRLYKFEVKRYK